MESDHDVLLGMLSRLKLTAVRDQLDSPPPFVSPSLA